MLVFGENQSHAVQMLMRKFTNLVLELDHAVEHPAQLPCTPDRDSQFRRYTAEPDLYPHWVLDPQSGCSGVAVAGLRRPV